jgi:hypothetical protein
VKRIEGELDSVPCNQSSGSLQQNGGVIGIYSENNALGNVDVTIDPYVVNWNAGDFDKECCRKISALASRKAHFRDRYTFSIDLTKPSIKQVFTDVIPAIIAVDGEPYWIQGEFTDQIRITNHKQCCSQN